MPTPMFYTDFEESISFDSDDPDFYSTSGIYGDKENYFEYNSGVLSPAMSLTSLVSGNRSHSFSSISSLDDRQPAEPAVLSIEELRDQLHSCFTCGVSWYDEHVSLDCAECGGYSLERPCPQCDGKCRSVWKRDLTMSHACGKAKWLGICALTKICPTDTEIILKPITTTTTATTTTTNIDNGSTNVYNDQQRNGSY